MLDLRGVACSSKRLLPSLLVLFTTGCGEPQCTVNTSFAGAMVGAAMIDGAGEDFCTAEKVSNLVIVTFAQPITTGFTGVSDLQVNIQSPELIAGTFPATVSVGTVSSSFISDSDACMITVGNIEVEDWTVTDYVNFAATVTCSEPLSQLLGGFGTLELGPTQIEGHVLYE